MEVDATTYGCRCDYMRRILTHDCVILTSMEVYISKCIQASYTEVVGCGHQRIYFFCGVFVCSNVLHHAVEFKTCLCNKCVGLHSYAKPAPVEAVSL